MRCIFVLYVCSVTLPALKTNHNRIVGQVVESTADSLMDAKLQIQQMDDLKKEVESLADHVKAGGNQARLEYFSFGCQHGHALTPGSLSSDSLT